ncbi:uncharacterized protein LOC135334709 [Halichondria panicea]|uniref:uncharacterized protein LOC135334709 n=1 Tax=Halichondria panicea TaxID=6063 RepID=UPI00312BAACF
MSGKTRTGMIYKRTTQSEDQGTTSTASASQSQTDMAETDEQTVILKALLEDRRTLEADLREERRVRAEEAAKRDEDMREQMDLLRGLIGAQGEGGGERRATSQDPKVAKLTDADDIEPYIVTFERLMTAYEVPANRWVFKLAPQLSGKAQQAYAALSGEAAANYTQVKESILRRYDVNEETYKRRFRTASVRTGETVMELRVRLEDLAKKWLKECDTVDKLRDAVVLEQFLNSLPAEVRVWVQEHKPKTSEAAAQLADNYLQARQDSVVSEGRESSTPNPIVCAKCNKRGHKARNCRVGVDDKTSSPPPRTERPKRDLKDITCFTCNQKGHYASNCPSKTNLMCVERKSNFQGKSELTQHTMEPKPGIFQAGTIEGHAVTDVCLDTGCTRTMVREDLVPVEKLIEGDSIAICCAHRDTVVYPLARIQVEVNRTTHEVEAAVSKTLPLYRC